MAAHIKYDWKLVREMAQAIISLSDAASGVPVRDELKHLNYVKAVDAHVFNIREGLHMTSFDKIPGIIFQTYRNADMIEGRGPMIPDLAFTSQEKADEYIDAQPGCMGRRANWSKEKLGDWEVRAVRVYEQAPSKKDLLIASAKAKLTKEELEALGHG